jgi:hypothetical protein
MTTNEKRHNVQNTDVNKPKPKTRFTRLEKNINGQRFEPKRIIKAIKRTRI